MHGYLTGYGGTGGLVAKVVVAAAPQMTKTAAVAVSRAKTSGTSKGPAAVSVTGSATTVASGHGGHERITGDGSNPLHVGLNGASRLPSFP